MSGSSSRLVVSQRVGTGESSQCGRRVNCAGKYQTTRGHRPDLPWSSTGPHVVVNRTLRGHHLDIRGHQLDLMWSSTGLYMVIIRTSVVINRISRGHQPDSTWSSSGHPWSSTGSHVVINRTLRGHYPDRPWSLTSRGRQPDSTWSSSGPPVVIKSHQLDCFCPAYLKLPSGLIHLKLHPCVNWNWTNLTVLTLALYRISETVPFSDVKLLV